MMIKRISNFLVKYHIIIWICLLMMVYCYLTINYFGFLCFGLFLACYLTDLKRIMKAYNLAYTQNAEEQSYDQDCSGCNVTFYSKESENRSYCNSCMVEITDQEIEGVHKSIEERKEEENKETWYCEDCDIRVIPDVENYGDYLELKCPNCDLLIATQFSSQEQES